MREILFRRKHDSDTAMAYKESWCYGVPYVDCDGDYVLANEGGGAVVIPQTVGQYTGLIDRNGKRIFEGDIIKGKEKATYAVGYSDATAGFYAKATSPQKMLPCMTIGTMKYYAVIGNIHDNPELLETN